MKRVRYKPVYKVNELFVGEGTAIIVTGWTPKDRVKKELEKEGLKYAAIGNLYSPNYGLTYIAANLLANPYNWDICLLGGTKADLFSNGIEAIKGMLQGKIEGDRVFNKEGQQVGRIENIFEEEQIKLLQEKVAARLTYHTSIKDLVDYLKEINKDKRELEQYSEPIIKEIPIIKSKTRSGNTNSPRVEGKTIEEVWVKILHLIRTNGLLTNSQYGQRQELISLGVTITEQPRLDSLKIKKWMPISYDSLKEYIPSFCYNKHSEETEYTYSNRIRNLEGIDQIERIVDKLIENPNSTQLYISLWDTYKDIYNSNPPCLVSIWVRLIDSKLLLEGSFRSQDMFTAYIANVVGLREIQSILVDKIKEKGLEVEEGVIITNSKSAHLYESAFKEADEIVSTKYKEKEIKEPRDSVGNFVIEVNDREAAFLKVKQLTPIGIPISFYEGEEPFKLLVEIINQNPTIEKQHIAYLGTELQKATFLKNQYKQG